MRLIFWNRVLILDTRIHSSTALKSSTFCFTSFCLQMSPQILWFPLLCHCKKVCVISYPLCLCPAILFPVMPLWWVYILLTEGVEIAVLWSWIMFEHSMCQKSIPFPCSQVVVYLLNPSKASLRFPQRKFFSGVGSLPPRPTPKLGDQGVPLCLGHHLWPVRLVWPCQYLCYHWLSSQDHLTTQASPLHQSWDTFGGDGRYKKLILCCCSVSLLERYCCCQNMLKNK